MSEDKLDQPPNSPKKYTSHLETKNNPVSLQTIRELNPGVELAEDASGRKIVVRHGRGLDIEYLKELGIKDFVENEFKLLKQFDIDTVNYSVVSADLGDDNLPQPSILIVSDYVDEPLENAPPFKQAEVARGLIRYYKQKLLSDENFLVDIARPAQFRYGGLKGAESQPYLVDIDFDQNSILHKHLAEHRVYYILKYLQDIMDFAKDPEGRKEIKNALRDFLNNVNPDEFSKGPDEGPNPREYYQFLLNDVRTEE